MADCDEIEKDHQRHFRIIAGHVIYILIIPNIEKYRKLRVRDNIVRVFLRRATSTNSDILDCRLVCPNLMYSVYLCHVI